MKSSLLIPMAGLVLLVGCTEPEPAATEPAPAKAAPILQPAPTPEPRPEPKSEPKSEPKPEPEKESQLEPKPSMAVKTTPEPKPGPAPEAKPEAEKEPDLGPPLVERPERLIRLDKQYPVFIDKEKKRVVIVGQICQRETPLELFACLKHTKEHEAIVTVNSKAMIVHAALLAIGAQPGEPVHFHPKFTPARGQEVEVEVVWKDPKGQVQRLRAQEWIKNGTTGKPMEQKWVFAGSGFWTDPNTGERHYQAEAGDLICVSNFASATLDVTIQSSATNDALMFEAFTDRIPEKGTPVTLVLTPQPRFHK